MARRTHGHDEEARGAGLAGESARATGDVRHDTRVKFAGASGSSPSPVGSLTDASRAHFTGREPSRGAWGHRAGEPWQRVGVNGSVQMDGRRKMDGHDLVLAGRNHSALPYP